MIRDSCLVDWIDWIVFRRDSISKIRDYKIDW